MRSDFSTASLLERRTKNSRFRCHRGASASGAQPQPSRRSTCDLWRHASHRLVPADSAHLSNTGFETAIRNSAGGNAGCLAADSIQIASSSFQNGRGWSCGVGGRLRTLRGDAGVDDAHCWRGCRVAVERSPSSRIGRYRAPSTMMLAASASNDAQRAGPWFVPQCVQLLNRACVPASGFRAHSVKCDNAPLSRCRTAATRSRGAAASVLRVP